MAQIDEYLKIAVSKRASDIHFSALEPIRMRIDGDLVIIEAAPSDPENLKNFLFEILSETEQEKCLKHRNLDKSYCVEGVGYFRVNIFFTRRGVGAVLRTIPQRIPTIESLGLPVAAKTLAESPKGLVLVTGPTGSGKSTTLAAMIDYINTNFPYHILTAEDPVEFVHTSKKSLINQREIGSSCETFADALKYALREDPDVILVGEMRDLETISLALTAAETGHLVFGTLHTRGAGPSVDRIIDSFPANQQAMIRTMLSESLIGVVSQSLLKRADKPGRVAAFEIMIVNHAISNLIREGKTFQMTSIIQTGKKDGMMLMDQHIMELVEQGLASPEDAAGYMEDPSVLWNRSKTKPAAPAAAPALTAKPSAAAGAPPSLAKKPNPPTLATPPKISAATPPTAPAKPPAAPPAPPAAQAPTPPTPAEVATVTPSPEAVAEPEVPAADAAALLTDLVQGDLEENAPTLEENSQFHDLAPSAEDENALKEVDYSFDIDGDSLPEAEPPAVVRGEAEESILNLTVQDEYFDTQINEREETVNTPIMKPAPPPASFASPVAKAPAPAPAPMKRPEPPKPQARPATAPPPAARPEPPVPQPLATSPARPAPMAPPKAAAPPPAPMAPPKAASAPPAAPVPAKKGALPPPPPPGGQRKAG